jgi:broad specificity phosphatase PhoE
MPGSQLPTSTDRRRRRRLRLIPIVGYSIFALGLAYFFQEQATTTVLFVRHAETGEAMAASDDPPLNERGRLRAEQLADFVADIDVVASVDAIYVNGTRRTQETAAPLAARLNITPWTEEDHYDVDRFMSRVLRRHKGQIVLVVSHGDAIAPLIDELHGSKRLPPFGPDDFGELYVVTIPWYGKVKTLRFHYGDVSAVRVSDAAVTAAPPPADAVSAAGGQ